MKNKVIRQLIGGVFVMTVAAAPAGTVLASPVAGIFSEISGESEKALENASEAVKSAAVTESVERFETELNTETESQTFSATQKGQATAGIMLAMGDMMSETVEILETESTEQAKETSTEAEKTNGTESATDGETATETDTENTEAEEAEAEEEEDVLDEDDVFFTEEVSKEFDETGIAQVEDFVNVRKEATTESDVVGKLYKNNACTVLGTNEDGTWLHIQSGDVDGYVSAEFVSVGDDDVIKNAARRLAKVNTETLYVRALPTQDSDVIGMVPDGEVLTVCDESHLYDWGWVGVSIEEGTGYVSAEFVELYTKFTHGETKEAEEERLQREEEERQAAAAAAAQSEAGKSSGESSSGGGGGGVSAPGSSTGSSVANYALQFVGNPYVYGGSSLTNGTDCSGFVMSVYAAFGVGLPHSSSALRDCGYAVDPGSMSPGDIVCYSGHVGICIGGGQIVHASTAATGIKVSTAYYRDILAVRRIF